MIDRLRQNKYPFRRFAIALSILFGLYVCGALLGVTDEDVLRSGSETKTNFMLIASYLSFNMSWALAYACAFKFPNQGRLVLTGIIIGAALLAFILMRDPSGFALSADIPMLMKLLVAILFGLIATTMQLGGAVAAFQFFKHYIRKTVWPRISRHQGS